MNPPLDKGISSSMTRGGARSAYILTLQLSELSKIVVVVGLRTSLFICGIANENVASSCIPHFNVFDIRHSASRWWRSRLVHRQFIVTDFPERYPGQARRLNFQGMVVVGHYHLRVLNDFSYLPLGRQDNTRCDLNTNATITMAISADMPGAKENTRRTYMIHCSHVTLKTNGK